MGLNGSIFDGINDLAGRVTVVDDLMKFAAEYLIFVMAAIVVASWFVRFGTGENRRVAVYSSVIAAVLALVIGKVITTYYTHPRPFVNRTDVVKLISHGSDTSFPSDHALAAFALAAGMGLYRPRFGIVLLVLACVIAFARVFVGVHYPGDVAGAAVIGIAAAVVVRLARPILIWIDLNIVQRVVPEPLR